MKTFGQNYSNVIIFPMLKEAIETVFLQSHWEVNNEIANILAQLHFYRLPS